MPQLYSPGELAFVQDKSQYVPAPTSNAVTIFTTSSRGRIGVPTLIDSLDSLYTKYGQPDYSKLTYGIFGAKNHLADGGKPIWMVRTEHTGLATLNLKVPVSGVVVVTDDTTNIMFVATAKSEGDWINDFSIDVTAVDETNSNVTFNVVDAGGVVVEPFTQVATATVHEAISDYFDFTIGDEVPFTTPSVLPASYTTAIGNSTLGVDNFNTAAISAIVDTPGIAAIINVADATGTPKSVFTATKKTTGVAGNVDAINVTYFNDVADIISFEVKIAGVVVETFNSIAIATVGTLTSAHFTFANVDATPWVAIVAPVEYNSAGPGGTPGVDEILSFAEMPAPYTDTDTVAGWMSNAVQLTEAIANSDLYPCDKMAAPGYMNGETSATRQAWSDAVALVENRGDCFLISETSRGLTAALALAEYATAGAPTSFAASAPYYPWLTQYDTVLRQDITLPPACFTTGVYSKNDRLGNIWDAPAGTTRGVINSANGLEAGAQVTQAHQDILYPAFINTIMHDQSARMIYVNGQKALTTVPSKRDRVNVSRLLIMVGNAAETFAKGFRFHPNIASTWRQIEGGVQAYLDDLISRGAFEAAVAVCDETTNTATRRNRNEMWVELHVVPVGAAEFIYIPINVLRSGDL